jgi:hypothetical protein
MYVEDLRKCISILRVCHMTDGSDDSNNSNNNSEGIWECKPFEPILSAA